MAVAQRKYELKNGNVYDITPPLATAPSAVVTKKDRPSAPLFMTQPLPALHQHPIPPAPEFSSLKKNKPAPVSKKPAFKKAAHVNDRRFVKMSPLKHLYFYLFIEEHRFSMNKMSLFILTFGLMVLGILFFVGGFTAAMTVIHPKGVKQQQTDQRSNWAHANQSLVGDTYEDQARIRDHAKTGGPYRRIAPPVPVAMQPFAGRSAYAPSTAPLTHSVEDRILNPQSVKANIRASHARAYQEASMHYQQPPQQAPSYPVPPQTYQYHPYYADRR